MATVVKVIESATSLFSHVRLMDGDVKKNLSNEIKKFVKNGAGVPTHKLIEAMTRAKMQPRDTAKVLVSQILTETTLPEKERQDLIYEFTLLLEKAREMLNEMKEKPPTGDALLHPKKELVV